MSNQFRFIAVNEKILPEEKAVISAVNKSMFGQGVFTTIKVKQGIPIFWDKHKTRLLSQAQQLGFTALPSSFSLENLIKKLVQKNALSDCVIKITIINGEPPLVIGNARALPPETDTIDVIMLPDTRDAFKQYKTINRLVNDYAHRLAEEQGAHDALFIEGGNIIESTMSNVFSLNKKGAMITPPIEGRGLQGITRKVLMEQTAILEEDIPKDTHEPLVLINSLRIRKVAYLNGKKLVAGEALFEKIKNLLKKAEEQYIQAYTA